MLKARLAQEFPGATINGKVGRMSSFEVTANGQLLHSKLKGQGGKCQTPGEWQKLLGKVKVLLGLDLN